MELRAIKNGVRWFWNSLGTNMTDIDKRREQRELYEPSNGQRVKSVERIRWILSKQIDSLMIVSV